MVAGSALGDLEPDFAADGQEVVDALRELREGGIAVPALIVSAHTDAGDGNGEREELEIAGYVTKPIDFDALFAKIAELT